MAEPPQPKSFGPSREQRLAEQLRENLRRRKAQARALGEQGKADPLAGRDSPG